MAKREPELRRMEGDLELMAAHISQLRSQVEDLTETVGLLSRMAVRFDTQVSTMLLKLKERRDEG